MTVNPNLTISDGILMGLGALIGLSLSLYWGLRAWRSTPEDWVELNRRYRPKSWFQWPIYGLLWQHFDSHGTWYLWQTRILSLLAALLCSFSLLVAAVVLLREH